MWPTSFREGYCKKFGCPQERYEVQVFWRALYRHALPVAVVVYPLKRNFFAEDFKSIRQLGLARSWAEFHEEVESLRYINRRQAGVLRGRLRIRVSGQRLVRLALDVFLYE